MWLIDFAKTDKCPDNVKITHRNAWEVGNHEDGYLIGLNNIIDIFSSIADELDEKPKDEEQKKKLSSDSSG